VLGLVLTYNWLSLSSGLDRILCTTYCYISLFADDHTDLETTVTITEHLLLRLELTEASGVVADEDPDGGSRMSRYRDTISTETKYTIASDRNCACFVSS